MAFIKKATMDTLIPVYRRFLSLSGKRPVSEIEGSLGRCIFNFKRNRQFSKGDIPLYTSISEVEEFLCSMPLSIYRGFCCVSLSNSLCKVSHCGFNLQLIDD